MQEEEIKEMTPSRLAAIALKIKEGIVPETIHSIWLKQYSDCFGDSEIVRFLIFEGMVQSNLEADLVISSMVEVGLLSSIIHKAS